MHVRFPFAALLAAVAVLALTRPALATDPLLASDDDTIRMSYEMLKRDTAIVPFRVEKAFKVLLASYKQQIAEIQADASLSDEQKKALTKRTVAHANEVMVLYDSVVKVTPVVQAATFHFFGVELPFPFTRQLPWLGQMGAFSGQGSIGVTFANTEHQGNGGKRFAIGISTLAGPTFTLGKPGVAVNEKRSGATGVKMFMGISVILPLREHVPYTRIGDLQGWYYGIAGEGSIDLGSLAMAPRTVQIGGYLPLSFDSLLVFAFAGTGAMDRPVAGQFEALNFLTPWGSDKSEPRSPIPFVGNWGTSKHHPKQRLEELRQHLPSETEMRAAIEQANRNLENIR